MTELGYLHKEVFLFNYILSFFSYMHRKDCIMVLKL